MGCVQSVSAVTPSKNEAPVAKYTNKYDGNGELLDLNVKTNQAFWKKIYNDAQDIFDYIQHDESISEYVSDYKHLLDRLFYLYKSYDGNIPKDRQLVTCDQNTVPFPLPKFVDDNRKTIRQWARSWVIFDCHVPTEGAWYVRPWHEYKNGKDTLTPDKIYRASYRPGTFYTGITGEAAWEVLPIGVVGNNITTPEQDSIWQQRCKRKDLNDLDRMTRRRQTIADYFNQKYAHGDTSYCDKYLNFAETLENGWKKFQGLLEQDS
jgi:hypothetical protein